MRLFSASQVKTKRECVRKWGLTKIAQIQTPSTPSQELGKDVDDNQLQPYLRDGRPFDLGTRAGDIANSGLAWLPEPKFPGLEVQKYFQIPSPSKLGFGYQGYLDLWLPYGGQPGFGNALPVVGDFKTTKSIRKWALREDGLRTDVQAQLYATWAILATRSNEINLSWLYLQTEGSPIATPTQVKVHTDEVAEQFRGIEEDAKEMFALLEVMPKGADPTEYALSLPPNPTACDNYGGCPFRHMCNLGPEDLIASIEKNRDVPMGEQMDLFSKLRKKKDAADGGPATVVEAPATVAASQEPKDADDAIIQAGEVILGINPPEKDLPPAPPVGAVGAKAKRGRPSGKKAEAAAVAETPAQPVEVPAEVVAAEATPAEDFDALWAKVGVALKELVRAKAGAK